MVFLGRGGVQLTSPNSVLVICIGCAHTVLLVSDIHYDTDKVASYCEVVGLNH